MDLASFTALCPHPPCAHTPRADLATNQYARYIHPDIVTIANKLPQVSFPNVSTPTLYMSRHSK